MIRVVVVIEIIFIDTPQQEIEGIRNWEMVSQGAAS